MEHPTMTQNKLGSYADYKAKKHSNKEFIFVLNHINQAPSYKSDRGIGVNYPPSVRVLLWDEVYDKVADRMRIIRYIPGEKSIYMDEQTPDDKMPKKNFHLEFLSGVKHISGKQTLLIEYLMTTNKNGTNPDRDKAVKPTFFTVDPGEGLKSVMDNDEISAEAQHFCYKGDWDEVAAYAMVLGIPLDRDSREIRYSLRMKAAADPVQFMKGLKSPSMIRKYFTMEAIKAGIIVQNKSTNTINWKDGGAITQAPIGKDLIEDFVEATFTPNGQKVYDTILGILKPEAALPKVKTELQNVPADAVVEQMTKDIKPIIPQVIIADASDDEIIQLVKQGIEKGIIVYTKPMWYKYAGESYQKEAGMVQALKGNPIMLAKLKKEIVN